MSETQQYETLKENFRSIIKRIFKKDLSKNTLTLKRYETDLIEVYNSIAKYIDECYDSATPDETHKFKEEILYVREKTLLCFGKLNLDYTLPSDLYEQLNVTFLRDRTLTDDEDTDTESVMSNSDGQQENLLGFTLKPTSVSETASVSDIQNKTQQENQITNGSTDNSANTSTTNSRSNSQENLYEEQAKMAQKENREFLRFAASTINRNYAGDPLALKSFINAVDLLKSATEETQTDLLRKFVISRLEGKALECVKTTGTLDEIVKNLEDSIKPDSSKVVEGKIMSLRYNRSQASEFSDEASKLADALQRSLVIEGYSLDKAKEITLERTVEMCRQNARNEGVKSIIASKDFKDPRDVVAKLIIEQTGQEKEKQILFYNKGGYQKQNKPFYKKNGGFN